MNKDIFSARFLSFKQKYEAWSPPVRFPLEEQQQQDFVTSCTERQITVGPPPSRLLPWIQELFPEPLGTAFLKAAMLRSKEHFEQGNTGYCGGWWKELEYKGDESANYAWRCASGFKPSHKLWGHLTNQSLEVSLVKYLASGDDSFPSTWYWLAQLLAEKKGGAHAVAFLLTILTTAGFVSVPEDALDALGIIILRDKQVMGYEEESNLRSSNMRILSTNESVIKPYFAVCEWFSGDLENK